MLEWLNSNSVNEEREKQVETEGKGEGEYENGVMGIDSGLGVKVMTEDQMEMLRKQISVYATICERLVDMHKSVSAHHEFPGMRLGNPYYDPLLLSAVHKIPSRQRWSPRPVQLEILERIFEQSSATPCRQKIKEITTELAQHGPISETNVYNWFQNRRARSKRKQSALKPNNEESEGHTEVESAKEKKKKKPEDILPDENLALIVDHMYFQSPVIGIDQLIDKAEVPGSYNPYLQMEQYDLFG